MVLLRALKDYIFLRIYIYNVSHHSQIINSSQVQTWQTSVE
jgi:hypothetical protein